MSFRFDGRDVEATAETGLVPLGAGLYRLDVRSGDGADFMLTLPMASGTLPAGECTQVSASFGTQWSAETVSLDVDVDGTRAWGAVGPISLCRYVDSFVVAGEVTHVRDCRQLTARFAGWLEPAAETHQVLFSRDGCEVRPQGLKPPVMCPARSSTCAAAAPRLSGTYSAQVSGGTLKLELDVGEPVRATFERFEVLPPPQEPAWVRYELTAASGQVRRDGSEVTLEGQATRQPNGGSARFVLSWRPAQAGVTAYGFLSTLDELLDLSADLRP
ncbi:MAG: hypothetical protein JNK82_34470 [Myxococcaceae bacterium]|nr:hypothetical protein [Myxococcaceae bacterium]